MNWRWQCLSPTRSTASRLDTSVLLLFGKVLDARGVSGPPGRTVGCLLSKQSTHGRGTGCLYCFTGRRYFYWLARKPGIDFFPNQSITACGRELHVEFLNMTPDSTLVLRGNQIAQLFLHPLAIRGLLRGAEQGYIENYPLSFECARDDQPVQACER